MSQHDGSSDRSRVTPGRASSVAHAAGVPAPLSGGVDRARLGSLAAVLTEIRMRTNPRPAAWDDDRFWPTALPEEARSQFLTIGNAINFRFWSIVDGRLQPSAGVVKGETFVGAMYMWRRLRTRLDEGIDLLGAEWLASLTPQTLDELLMDDSGENPLRVGAEDRLTNLNDLGERLASDWSGQFYNLVTSSNGQLADFVASCRNFRAFDDPLAKLTLLNALMHEGSSLQEFDATLPVVDYHVVKQLVRQGVVRVDASTGAKLMRDELLSDEEAFLLRSTAFWALVELADLAELRCDVLDNLLWFNRNICSDDAPSCDACPFRNGCERLTQYRRPLEITRHY